MKPKSYVLMVMILLVGISMVGGTLAVRAQSAADAPASAGGAYHLPLVMGSSLDLPTPAPTPSPTPTLTPEWATQAKTRSGIHLGNRNTDWQDESEQYSFLNQVGRTSAGYWPAAVVVQSDQLYDLQRFDILCQVSSASVKQANGHEYELHRYLTEGIMHHNLKVVIRITPSPGNFSDFDGPGGTHVLLTDEAPPRGNDYCGDSNTKVHQYRDILDIAKEMRAIYVLNAAYGWPANALFFEPANEPNYEWYQRPVDDGITNLAPNVNNKQAWIDMDEYFAALYDRAIGLQPNLQILAPSMSQGLFGEHYALGTCSNAGMVVFGGNGRTGLDFMKKVYGYDIGIDAYTTPKAAGFAWHNYWEKGQESWLPPFGLPQSPPTVDDYCQISDQYEPHSDHLFQYLSAEMQESISLLPAFITEADLLSPCQRGESGVATSKDAAATETRDSLLTFIEQETQSFQDTGYGAQIVSAWLLVNQFVDEEETCRAGGDPDGKPNQNYEINWHEAYFEDGSERAWFGLWWPATP